MDLLKECERYAALAELRKGFERCWKSTWGHSAPAEAFNAWLLEALSQCEVLVRPPLPCKATSEVDGIRHSEAVATWAQLQIPYSWPFSDDLVVAKSHFDRYLEALKLPQPPAWEGLPSADVEQAAAKVQQHMSHDASSEQDAALRLRSAALQTFRPLVEAATSSRLRAFLSEVDDLTTAVRQKLAAAEERACEPSLSVRETLLPSAAGKVRLELCGDLPGGIEGKLPRAHDIHAEHVEKLRLLFGAIEAGFQDRCWMLLTRYRALFGPHDEGAGWHMALTRPVFACLQADFGVSHELFASPLNCTLPSFCSVFPDTDCFFGSKGGFFAFCKDVLARTGGSFECNPPFEEGLMRRVVSALLKAIEALAESPVSVALVLPLWSGSSALEAALAASACRGSLRIQGDDHCYLNGRQHCCQERHRVLRQAEARGSIVMFLQNDAGAAKWRVTSERLEQLRLAWARGAAAGGTDTSTRAKRAASGGTDASTRAKRKRQQ